MAGLQQGAALAELLDHQAPVGQAGERVVQRQVLGLLLGQLALRDVGANGDVLHRHAILADEGHDGGVDPVQAAVLGAVAHLAVPHLAARDGAPQVLEEGARVMAGVDQLVGLADQLAARILRDAAELVVDLGDHATGIGDRHDGVGVQCRLDVADLAQALGQVAASALAFGGVGNDGQHAIGPAFRVLLRNHAGQCPGLLARCREVFQVEAAALPGQRLEQIRHCLLLDITGQSIGDRVVQGLGAGAGQVVGQGRVEVAQAQGRVEAGDAAGQFVQQGVELVFLGADALLAEGHALVGLVYAGEEDGAVDVGIGHHLVQVAEQIEEVAGRVIVGEGQLADAHDHARGGQPQAARVALVAAVEQQPHGQRQVGRADAVLDVGLERRHALAGNEQGWQVLQRLGRAEQQGADEDETGQQPEELVAGQAYPRDDQQHGQHFQNAAAEPVEDAQLGAAVDQQRRHAGEGDGMQHVHPGDGREAEHQHLGHVLVLVGEGVPGHGHDHQRHQYGEHLQQQVHRRVVLRALGEQLHRRHGQRQQHQQGGAGAGQDEMAQVTAVVVVGIQDASSVLRWPLQYVVSRRFCQRQYSR